ncbi:MAG: aldehyde ferredoxin oxidoreductase family protein [Candidatus Bathyarchaeia archaeon]
MISGGYLLKVARVRLDDGIVRQEHVDDEYAVRYVGGRGWGAKILYDAAEMRVEPLSPENKVVVAAGPLSGLTVPCSGKTSFSALSPATGLYGDSNMGGEFAVTLKRGGFDALILEGVSPKPVYVHVSNGVVEVKDARPYWGMLSYDAEDALRRDQGEDCQVAVVGPAAENLVKVASIGTAHGRQAARCGIAAILGHKRVKAIVAQGDGPIPVADADELGRLWEEADKYLTAKPEYDLWQREGTMRIVEWANGLSCLPTRNFLEAQYEKVAQIDGEAMERRTRIGRKGCYACSIACGQINSAKGLRVEGPEYETATMIGSNCALNSIEEVVEANYLCDQLGLDTISAGNIAAFAMECYEKGILDKNATGGLELSFGNFEALKTLLEMIAYRRGLGNLLAEGVAQASRILGRGSERFAMHVKGLEISGYDVRAAPSMALAYATADIGAHHNRAWAVTYDVKSDRSTYTEDKARWVIYLQHLRPLFDCLGVCRFPWVEFGLDPTYYARFYRAATGVKASLEELLKRSEAIWNLTRLINLRQGMKPGADWLPDRVFDDPIPSGPLKGARLDRAQFRQLLGKYYELRGWDQQGVPTESKLRELGIS